MIQIVPNVINVFCAALLGLLLARATWTDIFSRSISNKLILVGALSGIALHTLLPKNLGLFNAIPGGLGFSNSLGGFALGLCLLMPLHMLRAMGAGDVKLMAMVGAFLGPISIVGAVLLTFLAGGILAIAAALWTRTLRSALINVYFMSANSMINATSGRSVKIAPPPVSATKLPYAIAIAAGAIVQVLLERNGYGISL